MHRFLLENLKNEIDESELKSKLLHLANYTFTIMNLPGQHLLNMEF